MVARDMKEAWMHSPEVFMKLTNVAVSQKHSSHYSELFEEKKAKRDSAAKKKAQSQLQHQNQHQHKGRYSRQKEGERGAWKQDQKHQQNGGSFHHGKREL